MDEGVERDQEGHGFLGAVDEVNIKPVAQNGLGFTEGLREVGREGEAMEFLVFEWRGERVRFEDEVKRVGFEGFYLELGADA